MNGQKTPSWEPHGQALLAFANGDLDARIGIQMEGEVPVWMPVEIYFRSVEDLPGVEVYALELCAGRVLDVGAGSGVHALALQEEGTEVVALDIAPGAVSVMKQLGVNSVACADFPGFHSETPFNTLLFLMNGIGVAGTLQGLAEYLTHAHSLLGPNGQILMDSSDLRETGMEGSTDTAYFGEIEYRLHFRDQVGEPYRWLYVDPETLTEVAWECGWHAQVVYEAGEGSYLARLVKVPDEKFSAE